MIIVEGPDGAGKTTLIKRLLEDGVINKSYPSPWQDDVLQFEANILRAVKENGSNFRVAYDRFFYSELVYGPVIRHRCCFDLHQLHRIHQTINNSASVIVLCLPPLEEIQLNQKDRETLGEFIPEIYELY